MEEPFHSGWAEQPKPQIYHDGEDKVSWKCPFAQPCASSGEPHCQGATQHAHSNISLKNGAFGVLGVGRPAPVQGFLDPLLILLPSHPWELVHWSLGSGRMCSHFLPWLARGARLWSGSSYTTSPNLTKVVHRFEVTPSHTLIVKASDYPTTLNSYQDIWTKESVVYCLHSCSAYCSI